MKGWAVFDGENPIANGEASGTITLKTWEVERSEAGLYHATTWAEIREPGTDAKTWTESGIEP